MPCETQYLHTTCTRDCPNTCGLTAEVVNNRVVRLYGKADHPLNEGRVCTKCQRYLDRVYHPRRSLFPLIKKDGDLRRVSWKTALDRMADQIKQVTAEYGAESILYYQGFGSRTALKLINRRFFNLVGPVTMLRGTVCGGTGQAAQELDFGKRISHDFRDYDNSGALVIWGRNPAVTNINLVPQIKGVHRRGGHAVLIDPLDTKTAGLCDLHIKPRPGCDVFLALAAAQIILNAGAADQDFLSKCCDNYQAYHELVFAFDLDTLAQRCDVPLHQIEQLAQIIIKHKPVGFALGWGLHRWEFAHSSIRAIDALAAVSGSIGVSGGGVSQGFDEYQPYDWSVCGDALNPGARHLSMPRLAQELDAANPAIKLLIVTAGNPLAMLPDSNAVREAFMRIPFKIVMSQFLDDTASTADIFLPSTTFLEENDVVASYGHSFLGPVRQVIKPLGKAKSDFEMFMELGSRFSFAKEYVKTADEWLKIILKPTIDAGHALDNINAGGFFQSDVPAVPYTDRVFPTSTGRFQLLDTLEWYEDSQNQDPSHPLPTGSYRLMSTAPFNWLCSEIAPNQFKGTLPVTISTAQATELGLDKGSLVWVTSPNGELLCEVALCENQRNDLVYIPRGGWETFGRNVNVLTKAQESRVGTGTAYYETIVTLKPFDTNSNRRLEQGSKLLCGSEAGFGQ